MKLKIFTIFALMTTFGICARSCGSLDKHCMCYPFFIHVGSGYSSSMCAKINPDPAIWDEVKEGYSAKLNHAAVFEAGLGYAINDWLSASVIGAYRGVYHYKKFQTLQTAQTPTVGDTKTRYFDLENSGVLFNLAFDGINCWAWHFCNCMSLAPIIVGGIGLAQNRVSNFHAVLDELAPSNTDYVESIKGLYVSKYSFAAHADVGISWALCQRAQLNLGYCFYYGGTFKTSDYGLDVPGGVINTQYSRPIIETPWCSKLKANELFVNLNIAF